MTMSEIKSQIGFTLGLPSNENVEGQQIEQAVLIAFRELSRYMRTPVDKTVPFQTRITLKDVGIETNEVLYCFASKPRIGLSMGSIESGNVFQVAAAVNVNSMIGNTSTVNIDPIVTEVAMAQLRNTLSTDFQWTYDQHNGVVYCTHRDPRPSMVTIRYVPTYKDVSEIQMPVWIDYLIRLATAHMKLSLGRSRSKYKIEGSNVSLDGEILLTEANAELDALRTELGAKRRRLVVLN